LAPQEGSTDYAEASIQEYPVVKIIMILQDAAEKKNDFPVELALHYVQERAFQASLEGNHLIGEQEYFFYKIWAWQYLQFTTYIIFLNS
jgi:hypothetical protein